MLIGNFKEIRVESRNIDAEVRATPDIWTPTPIAYFIFNAKIISQNIWMVILFLIANTYV